MLILSKSIYGRRSTRDVPAPDPDLLISSFSSTGQLSAVTSGTFAVHGSGGLVSNADNVNAVGYISLPAAIDPTLPFRLAVLIEINDARLTKFQFSNAARSFWSGYSATSISTASISTFSNGTALNQYGGTGGIPAGTKVWCILTGDGARVTAAIVPDAEPTGLVSSKAFSAAWDGSAVAPVALAITQQYSSPVRYIYGHSSAPDDYLSRIYVENASTTNRIIGVFCRTGTLDGTLDAAFAAPAILSRRDVTQDESPWALIPGSYGIGKSKLVRVEHPNGNPSAWNSRLTTSDPAVCKLWKNGYVIQSGTGVDNQSDFAGATSSNWGAPAGMLYRKAELDNFRALLPRINKLGILGSSMGALNALRYHQLYPGEVRMVVGISGAINPTASWASFSSLIRTAYGNWYRCIQAGTGQTPSSSPTYWTEIASNKAAPDIQYFQAPYVVRNTYGAGTSYAVGDVVCVQSTDSTQANYNFGDPTLNPSEFTGIPIHLWHGDADSTVPISHMTAFAAAVGANVTTTTVSGAGHITSACYDAAAIKAAFDLM